MAFLAVTMLSGCGEAEGPVMYGNFEADEWVVPAEGSGRIVWLSIEEGSTFEKGEVVGLIDTVQLAFRKQAALARITALEATIPDIEARTQSLRQKKAAQEREMERISRLVEQGSAGRQMLEQAEDQLAVTASELSAAQTALQQEANGIRAQTKPLLVEAEMLEDQISRCVIANPEHGVVLTRYAGMHEYVATGHPLYKLANMDEMILRAWFPGDQLSRLEMGGEMQVSIDIPGKGMKHYTGKVTGIAQKPQFIPTQVQTRENRTTQHYEVKIRVPNDGSIKPGMPGEVRFAGNSEPGR